MPGADSGKQRRELVEAKLAELAAYAQQLCPQAEIELDTRSYEGEDGHVLIYPTSDLTEEESDRIGLAIYDRSAQIMEDTGLFILSGILDRPNAEPPIGDQR